MSEITKVCETCNDTRKVSSDAWEAPPVPCPDCCEEPEKVCGRCGGSGEQDDGCCVRCGGHGTVVDVQAQLDSARIMCERLESALRGKESENAESRAEVARLTNELGAEQAFHRSTKLSLSDERTSRQYWEREADTDHRAAAQLSAKAEAHARDMERRVTYALTKAEAEVTRLTATLAERDGAVARLEGREREAKRLFCSLPLLKVTPHFHEQMDVWLAGCKS